MQRFAFALALAMSTAAGNTAGRPTRPRPRPRPLPLARGRDRRQVARLGPGAERREHGRADRRRGVRRSRSASSTILDSDERIPRSTKHGRFYYNFWRDAKNPRGLWRRTTLDEYRKAEPAWETVLDLDALGDGREGELGLARGAVPGADYERCLVSLSRGGADADVVREFDLETRSFVKDGFTLPEAKSRVGWRDRDTLFVGTDFGPGSLTELGLSADRQGMEARARR